ncbi:uncharacterized protein LOC114518207 isoform X2 [Dendronephthya gigantea]|uniref:uncharacterized protein LOC114518207 isoform X2 n=1 Tax=Dendronephthya gigantea TaxID=151771 RepID=UPI00106CC0C3|nr:uncharacterized protein LOC114518207 isoform X2 [Dendronephthya gigantea]
MAFYKSFIALIFAVLFRHGDMHSWVSCPRSFDPSPYRGGNQIGPCEPWYHGVVNPVKAGDRIKVGWTSNNHGGGFVRLALVPESEMNNREAYKRNVLKFTCYGHDQRPGRYAYGDCKHPCNARPGCEYQSERDDVERYDTTLTIPYNLKDGVYVLQWISLVGNIKEPYYSCVKLKVSGGNSNLNCHSNDPIPTAKCHRSGGPPMDVISKGTTRGKFCFRKDGVGHVDENVRQVPINVDCDPRITCQLSIWDGCKNELTGIENPWNPRQKNCGSIVPPPPPTCSDGRQNQGEEDVDCGGPNCAPCPEPTASIDEYAKNIKHKIDSSWATGFSSSVEATVIKRITGDWQLVLFFDNPVEITSIWGAKKFFENKLSTHGFQIPRFTMEQAS